MLNTPLVSVLICAYNVEKYIEECINAVINQTYKNLEIIVVNDGSSDSTLSKLHSLSEKDSRIKIINNSKNLGFISSLNIGIEYVSGDYVARTDADDITKPDWIEKILGCLEKEKHIIAMGSYIQVLSEQGNGSNLSNYYEDGQIWKNPTEHKDIFEQMLFRNPIHNNSMVVRSSVFNQYGLRFDSSYKHTEDYKFWLDVSRLGYLANYPEPLVYYRFHSNQTSSLHNEYQNLMAKKIRRIAINYYLSDLGVEGNVGEVISFEDVVQIQSQLSRLKLLKNDIVKEIIYDFYFSLEKYSLFHIFSFIVNKDNSIFSRSQKVKIIKKMIRPYKYNSPL
ncbi:glycosyltransferase family 2 protein [Pasteurella multocida]|uniref:glycosyltransferase family 2 protein n=1 Tax=Pasteurella multocida TaxID=747 RepID=UPI0014804839|nr:glycosyltransferase family 2 protein [Pasteurella multocida]NNI31445.1 glycosyltransferase family 2 protein [Pasteurella multocida]NNI61784.1 glycosyltransferase family 2 protein [Pasteurella multocida]NNI76634.1 glycosyltransferase family 2 protein [Pasteurella multocida]